MGWGIFLQNSLRKGGFIPQKAESRFESFLCRSREPFYCPSYRP